MVYVNSTAYTSVCQFYSLQCVCMSTLQLTLVCVCQLYSLYQCMSTLQLTLVYVNSTAYTSVCQLILRYFLIDLQLSLRYYSFINPIPSFQPPDVRIENKFAKTVQMLVSSFKQGFHEMAKSFAQNLRYFRANFFFANFFELSRYFCARNAMSFARFCAIFFAQLAQNRKYFLRNEMKRNFSFAQFFLRNLRKTASFTQNVTFQANCQKLIF